MHAVHSNKAAAVDKVRSRGYALRFDPQVPTEVIGSCISKASRQLRGPAHFSSSLQDEVIAGTRVTSSYLHASSRAWSAFQERPGGFVAEAGAYLERVVAWPAAIRNRNVGEKAVSAG